MDGAELIRKTTAATLRQVAEWGLRFDGSTVESTCGELHGIANKVEQLDPDDDLCCPVCEEVECDGGCPLESVRAQN
jgi:hypothetical protein